MSQSGSKVTVGTNRSAVPELSLSIPAGLSISSKRPRALVADDDPLVVAVLQRILTRKGFDVATARDGDEAWVLATSLEFSLILTDLEMPRAGGVELFDEVRALNPDIPFIFVTGRPTLESAVELMNKGASAYIRKPFEPEQVAAAIERTLQDVAPMSTKNTGRHASARFALGLAELHLHYQPIIRWSTRSTFSYEALMRTAHTEIPHPGAFLDLAEGLGSVHELGRAVRQRVASDVTHLPNSPETVFINLHPEELLDDELFSATSPLSAIATRCYLEITERESLSMMDDAVERIRALKEMGYRIAIDDIGAGYSGLNSFVDLEPDLVKIDMGLVRGIDSCSRRPKLVRSLLALARELDIDVVAEGVETERELATLVEFGCDLFQGYFFSKPAPPYPKPVIPKELVP
jgi:EAL domain-containing protein (putative c-di-GMP-specific phosphodiesterase class I)